MSLLCPFLGVWQSNRYSLHSVILAISFAAVGIIIVLIIAHRAEKNADEWVELAFPDSDTRQTSEGTSS